MKAAHYLLQRLSACRLPVQFTILYIVTLAYDAIVTYLVSLVDENALYNPLGDLSFGLQLLVGVIVGPVIETYLFQYLPMVKLPWKYRYRIIFSAVLFGILHFYNIYYVLWIIPAGILMTIPFLLYNGQNRKAFAFVAVLHALSNLTAFLLDKYT